MTNPDWLRKIRVHLELEICFAATQTACFFYRKEWIHVGLEGGTSEFSTVYLQLLSICTYPFSYA